MFLLQTKADLSYSAAHQLNRTVMTCLWELRTLVHNLKSHLWAHSCLQAFTWATSFSEHSFYSSLSYFCTRLQTSPQMPSLLWGNLPCPQQGLAHKAAQTGGVVHVVECLPRKHEALNSNSSTEKKKKKKSSSELSFGSLNPIPNVTPPPQINVSYTRAGAISVPRALDKE
jgi:hypothetical protein